MHSFFKKYVPLLCMACMLLPVTAQAQVTVNATIDSLQLLVGEQAKIKLEVSCNADQQLTLPQTIGVEGIELVGEVKADTQYLNKKARLLVTQEYTVTSFDTAFYYIPPFEVKVDSQAYESNSLALSVLTFNVDTLHTDQICGIKDVAQRPLTFVELLPLIMSFLLFIGLGFLIYYLIGRYRSNKPILRRVTVAPKLPPHQLALQEMDRIKAEKSWQREDPKEYYTQLTDVLRQYMQGRFNFNAMEMTSDEIIEALTSQPDQQSVEELKELFSMSDLVKFAKYKPLMNENDMNLVNAIDFINHTKPTEAAPQAPVVEEIVVKEGRSKQAKAWLITGIVVLCIIAAASLYVAISESVFLLS